jgi:hypothetical protein
MKALAIALVTYHFSIAVCRPKESQPIKVRYWEIIADRVSASGWSWGCIAAIDSEGGELSGLLMRIATTARGLSLVG